MKTDKLKSYVLQSKAHTAIDTAFLSLLQILIFESLEM